MTEAWTHIIRIDEVPRGGRDLVLEPEGEILKQIARYLDIKRLHSLSAQLSLQPWNDGVEITGAFRARITQSCVVTLDPIDSDLSARFKVQVVPEGSLYAPSEEAIVDFDPEAEDPPEVTETGEVDLALLVVEHLALEIDPYPRKEGAVFEPPVTEGDESPFAVLKTLKKE